MKKMRRNVGLGASILAELDRYVIAAGTARSAEVVRLATVALGARRGPPLRSDRYLSENTRAEDGGTVCVYADARWWKRVSRRAETYGESVSESLRALVSGGMAIAPAPPSLADSLERVEGAMGHRGWKPGELASAVWSTETAFSGGSGAYAALRALELLQSLGRVWRAEDGKWERGAEPSAR